jgi:ferredoxin
MRVVINPSLCAGHGRCYKMAPEVFEDDERGYGRVTGDGQLAENYREAAKRAVVACPERAIAIVD